MGVLTIRALPFGVCIRAPDFWKFPRGLLPKSCSRTQMIACMEVPDLVSEMDKSKRKLQEVLGSYLGGLTFGGHIHDVNKERWQLSAPRPNNLRFELLPS